MLVEVIIPLISLIAIEVILGIDNIIFISIIIDKLPKHQQNNLRYWGLGLALVMRLGLLGIISVILKLDQPLFNLFSIAFSGKGIILIAGGVFLVYKSIKELYVNHEIEVGHTTTKKARGSYFQLLIEIIVLDLVFSIDSIITSVGMVRELWMMYVAVIVAVVTMLIASKPISDFVSKNPAFKILAICFLLLVGCILVAEGFHVVVPKEYIYSSMAFAILVNVVQMRALKKQ